MGRRVATREEKQTGLIKPLQPPPSHPPQAALTLMTSVYLQMYIVSPDLGGIKEFLQLAVLAKSLKKNSTRVLSFNARQALLLLPTNFSCSKSTYLVRFGAKINYKFPYTLSLLTPPFQTTDLLSLNEVGGKSSIT